MHSDFCRVFVQKVVDCDTVEHVTARKMDVEADVRNIAQAFQVIGKLLCSDPPTTNLFVNLNGCTGTVAGRFYMYQLFIPIPPVSGDTNNSHYCGQSDLWLGQASLGGSYG